MWKLFKDSVIGSCQIPTRIYSTGGVRPIWHNDSEWIKSNFHRKEHCLHKQIVSGESVALPLDIMNEIDLPRNR